MSDSFAYSTADHDREEGLLAIVDPFVAAAQHRKATVPRQVPDDAPARGYTYALLRQGPPLAQDEVERVGVPSVEVTILWGSNVLHVEHLTPPRDYGVGQAPPGQSQCDYFIPASALGAEQVSLVEVYDGQVRLLLKSGWEGTVELPGRGRVSLDAALPTETPGAERTAEPGIPLVPGTRARLTFGNFVVVVAAVAAGRSPCRMIRTRFDTTAATYFTTSLLAHAGLLAACAFGTPPLGIDTDEVAHRDRLRLAQAYLGASQERDLELRLSADPKVAPVPDGEGEPGLRGRGAEGSMGKPHPPHANRRYGIRGPQDNPEPHISRSAALREARAFGLVGLLNAGVAGDPEAPVAPWGRYDTLGTDEASGRGNLWGDSIGASFGRGGLGLTGVGEGGGGRGEGIGLGSIGIFGHGFGCGGGGGGCGHGEGSGHGRISGRHVAKSPRLRFDRATTSSGRLPPEVIQRVVRQNHGRFRGCYERGLSLNPELEGRVVVRFVIARDGSIASASNGGSDLPDSAVTSCIVQAFYGLSFPPPGDGIATVVYPIHLSPA